MKYLSAVEGKDGISARVVAASIANNTPLWTLEIRAPKFLDAEFEKHRMLSSNSSSSRAIPFKPNPNPYIPSDLRRKQRGMQGYESLTEQEAMSFKVDLFNNIKRTNLFLEGWQDIVHKQHLNRYTEAWTLQTKVVTGTEWDNFFLLRSAANAQPEIQEVARCMQLAMAEVIPKQLRVGEWHLPYVDDSDLAEGLDTAIMCSVARCARTSYVTHDRKPPDAKKDVELYSKLFADQHMSTFEHQGTPMRDVFSPVTITSLPVLFAQDGVTHLDNQYRAWSGNLRNWIQYRQLVSTWN